MKSMLFVKCEKCGRYKLVSEPRFEGFEHNVVPELKPKARKNGCVRSETQIEVKLLRKLYSN
ncbi:hypothetical protein HanXRQr2_Chr09g0366131 [Helianthus annuus]|uniref:Uncharacterized protein n=1 Tax=Helianthus annuus TaxID=4232 RepID=A0A9K3N6X1_HELAN|nr:hypothetical protein HanXRQr2_Chr09g0366131 [Helianthus annuus]